MRALMLGLLAACTLEKPVGTGESGLDSAPWDDPDQDGYPGEEDCQPEDFASNPAAPERCDGIDNDCDGAVDEDDAVDAPLWYQDADGDGQGADPVGPSCAQPAESAAEALDCDDGDASVFVGAEEICGNGKDDDCDGEAGCRWEGALAAEDIQLLRIDGDQSGGYAGKRVTLPGDVDGDGAPDLLLTAAAEDGSARDMGAFYVFRGPLAGGSATLADADGAWWGEEWDYAGYELVGAGDLGGEGLAAVALGMGGYDATVRVFLDLRGELYTELDGEPALTLSDSDPDSAFGQALAGGGDLDGDGGLELAASATAGEGGRGRLGIYAQDAEEILVEVGRVLGSTVGDEPGASLAFADLNGDGGDELLVGAPGLDEGAEDGGGVYLLDQALREGGALDDAARVSVDEAGCEAGRAVAGPDADGDGYADLLFGGPFCANRSDGDGAAWLAAGGPTALTVGMEIVWRVTGQEKAQVGAAVASGGDMDGDGQEDLLVGAPQWSAGGVLGAVLLWYGPLEGSTSSDEAQARFQSEASDEIFGYSVAGGADLSGDGLPDFAAGGVGAGGNAGLARVIPGLSY